MYSNNAKKISVLLLVKTESMFFLDFGNLGFGGKFF